MFDPGDTSEPDIEALVWQHLDEQATAIDVSPMVARLHATLERPNQARWRTPPRESSRSIWWSRSISRRVAFASVVAATVVAAFVAGRWLGPSHASAETLLRNAQKAHAMLLDRCYLIECQVEPHAKDLFPVREGQTRLWTRGDRFWIELWRNGRLVAYGRDEQRRIWVARSPNEGILYEDREEAVPLWLTIACDVSSMRIETLLDDVLHDFVLTQPRETERKPERTHVIEATLAAGRDHPSLLAVRLEVDRETDVLKRVVLKRSVAGRHAATVTYTLVDSGIQDDAKYRLEGHLAPGAKVYSRKFMPAMRVKKLERVFERVDDSNSAPPIVAPT